ncbi:MAG: outer membrane lipoprotein-sorting protein [Elusimicrobia bacterium]|nr:outer membrane lipoprotein-sorting protein [Elusimicrobiota bacterium]
MKKLFYLTLFIFAGTLFADTPSGETVLKKVDQNYYSDTRISVTSMVIKGQRATRTIEAKSWGKGYKTAYTEYLAPPREKGTKMLKINNELWMYTPSTDRIIAIAGHMLRQSLMGSDISYEDFMEDPQLNHSYNAKVSGEENIDGRKCYVLDLTAKIEDISYYARKMWVDEERYVPLKEDLIAKSGRLLKTIRLNEVQKIGERWYPKRILFKDVLQSGDGTEIIIKSIQFNVNIPNYVFSKASLKQSN